MRTKLVAFLRSLNTHLVAWIGLGSVVLGSFADPTVQADFTALVAVVQAGKPLTADQRLRIAVRALVLLGAIGAYLGRPRTVPADPPAAPKTP